MAPFIDEDFAKRVDASLLRAVLDVIDAAVVIRDLTGRFVAFNESALTVLGATADQLLGKAPHDPKWRAVLSDGSPVTADQSPTTIAMRTGKTTRRKSKSKKGASGTGAVKTPRPAPHQEAQVQYPFPAADPEEEEPEPPPQMQAQGKRVPQMRTAKARDGGRTQSGGIKGVLMDDADDF